MARVNPPIDIKMEVPSHLKKFLKNPTPEMKNARKAADKKALFFLRNEIKQAAPKKSGKLKDSITVDLNKNNVYSIIAHARAVELGHYARAEEGHFLQFPGKASAFSRNWVYQKFVRTEKQPFFFPTLSKNRLRLLGMYEESFAKMLKKHGRKL